MPACRLVVIGGSWGGTEAVGRLLADLPETFSLPVAVALHRSPGSSEEMLVKSLSRMSKLRVVEPDDKTALERGVVYVAPADYHLLVERGSFALSVDERIQFARPSIDVLFESAADAYGAGVIGIILTGANEDGALGLARIKERAERN